jgi:Reverse transcriptase (RNA-dependent DNA polymerase)
LQPKAKRGTFIGYTECEGKWRVLTENGRVETSRDVTFLEDQAPNTVELNSHSTPTKIMEQFTMSTDNQLGQQDSETITETLTSETPEDQQGTGTQIISLRPRERTVTYRQNRTYRRKENEESKILSLEGNDPDEPSVKEALSGPDSDEWKKAIASEILSLERRETWIPVDLPEGATAIGSRIVLKKKRDERGNVCKLKARLVAQGFSQTHGINYQETFAPVANITSILTALALAVKEDMEVHQIDIESAYLNANLQENIYMSAPKGIKNFEFLQGRVLKLKKSLYGLKQAGFEWHSLLKSTLISLGWTPCKTDSCVYIRAAEGGAEYLLVYVDDIIVIARSTRSAEEIKTAIASKFDARDLGPVKHILGIHVQRNRALGTMALNQTSLLEKLLQLHAESDQRTAKTPMVTNTHMESNPDEASAEERHKFQQIVGGLLYLSRYTRPDISYATSACSRHASNPSTDHFKCLQKILQYLRRTTHDALTIRKNQDHYINAYTDADHAGCTGDRKSTSGYAIFYNRNLVAWGSKKQPVVAQSTTEAEYIAAAEGAKEVLYIKQLIEEMCEKEVEATLHCDNQSSIEISLNPKEHQRTKHIDIRYHFIRDLLQKGTINMKYVPSEENIADIFTKATNPNTHKILKDKLRILPPRGFEGVLAEPPEDQDPKDPETSPMARETV